MPARRPGTEGRSIFAVKLRVAASIEGTVSATRPRTVRFRPSISTSTCSPIRTRPRRDSSIEVSRRRLPSRSTVSSGAPGVAKLPGSALRSVTRPAKGAESVA